MKSIFLIRLGKPEQAFEIRETKTLVCKDDEVLIKVEAFGLNFADVMARKGLYDDCPPLPCVLGYDVVGRIEAIGKNVTDINITDRLISLTRFGGYAEYVIADARAVVKISDEMPTAFAASLATQYCTAYFAAMEATKISEGEIVLVHAAAGGVGTALVQLLKLHKAIIIGTCSSDEKINYLRTLGVQHPINYKTKNYIDEIKKIIGDNKLDAIFDSLGGKYIRDGMKLLGPCGRMVCFGGAELNSSKNIFSRWRKIIQFGFYHPGIMMMQSKAIIGVNMLKVGDNKPQILKHVLTEVVALAEKGLIKPSGGKEYSVADLAAAHNALENRTTIGKIVVKW